MMDLMDDFDRLEPDAVFPKFITRAHTTAGGARAGSGAGAGGASGMPAGGLIRGDVATVARLRQAARRSDALAEQVQIILGMVHAAAGSLPDRLAQADWGTDAVTTAGGRVAEAVAVPALNAQALAGLLEQLGELDKAVDAAEQLGAEVLARQADGKAEAFAAD
jgi:hypothetical protein